MGKIIYLTLTMACFTWTILAAVSSLAVSVRAETTDSSESNQNPKLVLTIDQPKKSYILEKYVHDVEPNVILVNKTGILTLRLDCWAPYPIDLRFHGHLTNQETTVKTFRKEHGTSENPKSYFIINATMETYEQITGNYTCFSVEDATRMSSYYIFVSPTPPGVLLTRGQKIKIQPNPEERKVIFPCAVSHPDVHVQLLKNNRVVKFAEESYDPKIGFSMTMDLNDPSIYGSYSCRTELSPKDHVNFTLIRPKKFRVHPNINNIRMAPNGQLNVSCKATEDFKMIILPVTTPVIKNEVKSLAVADINDRDEPYYRYTGNLITASLNPNISGYVSCIWNSSNEKFAQWSFSVLNKEIKKPGELDTAKLTTACPKVSEIIRFECSNPVECRINSCLRKDSLCQSNGEICPRDEVDEHQHCIKNGLIQCVSDTTSVQEIFFTGYPGNLTSNKTSRYVEWTRASSNELLILEEALPTISHDKKTANVMKFNCQGSNFVFSSGFKWTIYFLDGQQTVITSTKEVIGDDMNVTVNNSWKEKKSNLESTLTIFALISSKKIISHIECHAPVWDSWQWISQKIPVEDKVRFISLETSETTKTGNNANSTDFSKTTIYTMLVFWMFAKFT